MAKAKESLVTKFYDSLKEGKIYGTKCRECKHISFPPKAGCEKCGSHRMQLKQVSGDGELLFFSSGNLPPKKFAKYHPYAYGAVALKEGPIFFTQIENVDVGSVGAIEKQNEDCPMKVKAKVKKMAGMEVVVFRVIK